MLIYILNLYLESHPNSLSTDRSFFQMIGDYRLNDFIAFHRDLNKYFIEYLGLDLLIHQCLGKYLNSSTKIAI